MGASSSSMGSHWTYSLFYADFEKRIVYKLTKTNVSKYIYDDELILEVRRYPSAIGPFLLPDWLSHHYLLIFTTHRVFSLEQNRSGVLLQSCLLNGAVFVDSLPVDQYIIDVDRETFGLRTIRHKKRSSTLLAHLTCSRGENGKRPLIDFINIIFFSGYLEDQYNVANNNCQHFCNAMLCLLEKWEYLRH
ncbi:hypothetical protein RCL1_005044 [Eukaryota sp. TZLM3-RCL]